MAAGCTKSGSLGTTELESAASTGCVEPKSQAERDVVCSTWACGRAGLSAASWDGDAVGCVAGTFDHRSAKRALALVNAYRILAGVPEVELDPRWNGPAQECALLAHANKALSHTPPRDWSCWNDRAARASAVSLVANRSAPLAIDPFIEDPGNERTMGHRRWLLSEKIHRIGLGSTSRYTCALVDGREWDAEATPRSSGEDAEAVDPRAVETGAAPEVDAQEDAGEARAIADVQPVEKRAADGGPDWVAWPPPGPVPIDALRRTRVDVTGWTIQSSSLDLDDAKVDVRVDGFTRPIVVRALERTTGSLTAIRFLPKGWSTEPDRRYDVHLEKGDTVIDFTVEPIHCP